MIFAIALIPIMGAIGAAIDYSRANSARTAMQAALDSTALMLSKDASTLTTTQITTKANDYFKALYNRPEVSNVTITPVYTAGSSSMVINGSGTLSTNFMGLFNIPQMHIGTSSTAMWGAASKMRVALVLDNTGSMLQTDASGTSKISALKTASHNLLNIFKAGAQTAGDIQVAIIPFGNYVKVDPTVYVNKPWINYNYSGSSGGAGDDGGSSSGCNGGDGGGGSSDPCSPSKSNWNGCFTDRNQSYDVQNTTPIQSNQNTWFPAVNCSITSMMPMSYDWTALNSKIDAMVAAGTTNQPIGLVWGWQALTTGDPLNFVTPPAGTQQVIILLTDGLNTQNRWTTNQSSIDAREALVCANIKAAGITIYTILVMSGNSTVLQNCASDASKYFALTNTSQIGTTFNTIGTNLSKLRIAR